MPNLPPHFDIPEKTRPSDPGFYVDPKPNKPPVFTLPPKKRSRRNRNSRKSRKNSRRN